jgi:hypothetical protein
MTETVTIDRAPDAQPKPAKVERRGKATVSASALAVHLDCSRAYICKLEAEGVIERQDDGFPLDQSRISYLRYLRRERQRSPRSEADVAFQNAKTKLIEMRISERERATIPMTEVTETIDQIVGVMLTHLGGMPARVAGHDLQLRRKVEAVVFETRLAISEAAGKMADQRDEPAEPAA